MCNPIDDNRKFLSQIIFRKNSFTAREIIDEYKASRGNAIIDGSESIRGFLRGLEENGSLRSYQGRYVVIK